MVVRTYNQILQQLSELCIRTENNADVLLCYALAQLNIHHSRNPIILDGLHTPEFSSAIEYYHLETPLPEYIYDVRFTAFCQTLRNCKLDTNYKTFLEYFTPRLVSQWEKFQAEVHNRYSVFECSVILYWVLIGTNNLSLQFAEINRQKVKEIYHQHISVFRRIGIDEESFIAIWEAVFYIPMPKLKVSFSKKLIEAVKFYRKHKVSGLALLKNYCQYNKHKTQLDEAFNPWVDFERVIKNRNPISGVSISESAFNIIQGISRELPADIIRAAIYPHPEFFSKNLGITVKTCNDGRFECSFLLQEFAKLAKRASNILIVNPGPDFLLRWNDQNNNDSIKCTVAVPNIYFASAYRTQFPRFKFCLFSDLDSSIHKFDLVSIISTYGGNSLNLAKIMSCCSEGGRIIALLPQTLLTQENNIGKILQYSSCHAEKIISISSHATVTSPAKKMLLFANNIPNTSMTIPIFFTQCDSTSDNLVIEKHYTLIHLAELSNGHTLKQLRLSAEKKEENAELKTSRNKALIYSFSDEIKLRYTIHIDKRNTHVGEVYYKALSRKDKRGKSEWDSGATQKGLRSNERQFVIANLEATAYYDQIAHCITGDILNFYGNHIYQCSMKTIWFCCRDFLASNSSYDDTIARTILFPSTNSALASIHPDTATDDDYREAMESIIPVGSKAIVKYWQQINLIMKAAVTLKYLYKNPIPALLPEISKKASKELQNLRNALTKKTFTVDEEHRIMDFICADSDVSFGSRKAKNYEVESIWLLGAIRLFTGLSIREVCALTWADFNKIAYLDCYQFQIYKFIKDDGSITYCLDGSTSKFNYRKVPIAPALEKMLSNRLSYMRVILGFSESEIKEMPIILPSRNTKHHQTSPFCQYSDAVNACRKLIEVAQIPSQELILPGSNDIVVDMNKYQSDIFYSNFKHRANHVCAFLRGELAYILGNKGPDTFSQHYCDYSSDMIQYGMAQKLRRWTLKYESNSKGGSLIHSEGSTFSRKRTITSSVNRQHYNMLDITLTPTEIIPGSSISIQIDCEHGVTGTIAVYPKKED